MNDPKDYRPSSGIGLLAGLKTKNVVAILVILISGGGGVAALDFATKTDVKEYIQSSKDIEDKRHGAIDKKFEKQDMRMQELGDGIESVQQTQIREIARKEARRLTAKIKDRDSRELLYDRLFAKNMRRLKDGKDPCGSLTCDAE